MLSKLTVKIWQKSLISRLVVYFLFLSLFSVSSVGLIAFLGSKVVIKRLVIERLRITAKLKEEAMNLWVDNQREAVVSLAQLSEIRTQVEILLTDPENEPEFGQAKILLQRYVNSAVTARPELEEVFILSDVGGKIIFSTNPKSEGQYRVKDRYFIEGKEKPFVQNIYPSSFTGKPTMTISAPIFSNTGKRLGVLATHLNLDSMEKLVLDKTGLGDNGESYLVDAYNSFVTAKQFGRPEFPRGVHSEGITKALQGKKGGGLYLNYAGIPVIGYYRWSPQKELALMVEIPQSEAFKPARQLAWGIFIVGLGSGAVLTLGVVILAKEIAKPVLLITEAAIKVADGDLNQTAPILTEDEVGKLALAFNQMTQKLRLLYEEMATKVYELQVEKNKSENLLLNILPQAIAERLKEQRITIADHYDNVTVMFADIVSFTKMSSNLNASQLVHSLNMIFSAFDLLAENYGVEKIKTIGDAYMVVGGLPTVTENHAEAIAAMALEMIEVIKLISHGYNQDFNIRIGINTGPVIAGVIGLKKFSYDLWGDTVNIASRMESQGVPGCIQVTDKTYQLLQHKYLFKERGLIEVKGKGEMFTYLLRGKKV